MKIFGEKIRKYTLKLYVSDSRIIGGFELEGAGGVHLIQTSGQSKAKF